MTNPEQIEGDLIRCEMAKLDRKLKWQGLKDQCTCVQCSGTSASH